MTETPKTKKPTVGFSARFFWATRARRTLLAGNGLQHGNSSKNGKTFAKAAFSFGQNPDFLQKRPIL
ncbi:MAG TPA: hypothetical protein VGO59_07875 [Verrucomicrobiae bacterium]